MTPRPDAPPPGAAERRSVNRRIRTLPYELRVRVTPGLERGWLAFASSDEKRRFVPIPSGWEQALEHELEALCRQAQRVERLGGRLIE